MIVCGGVGVSLEIEFGRDDIEYSVFRGSESVETDITILQRILEDPAMSD